MHALTVDLLTLLTSATDPVPQDQDVTAGWVAFGIFIALAVAVAFLGRSLVKQLRKVDAAEEAGLYDPSDRKPAPGPAQEPAQEPHDRTS
jgi:hypothetical protein